MFLTHNGQDLCGTLLLQMTMILHSIINKIQQTLYYERKQRQKNKRSSPIQRTIRHNQIRSRILPYKEVSRRRCIMDGLLATNGHQAHRNHYMVGIRWLRSRQRRMCRISKERFYQIGRIRRLLQTMN